MGAEIQLRTLDSIDSAGYTKTSAEIQLRTLDSIDSAGYTKTGAEIQLRTLYSINSAGYTKTVKLYRSVQMVSITWRCRLASFFSALLELFWILISQVREMEEQRKQFSEDCMDRARELDSQNGSETERTGDCGVRGHKRNEVQSSISKVQSREKQLPRGRETEQEAFRKNWRCQQDSETLKKLPVEGPREMQGKMSPMILTDLNEAPPQPLFGEGSLIAELRKDTPQSIFGEGSFIAAHFAAKDSRDLDERDFGKRTPKPQHQPHKAGTLLFGPGSLITRIRSGINCIESEKPAMDESVLREIGLNMLGGEERPGVRPEEVQAMKHREEGVDRGVGKENLDLLCDLAMRIGRAERPGEKVEITRHREEGGDFHGTREENFNEMAETDRGIYSENLSLYKGSGTRPAKPNSEAVGLITLEEAAREDVKFVDEGFPTRPKLKWEDLKWEFSKSLTRSTIQKACLLYNNDPTPIQIAATVSACKFPTLKKYLRLLKRILDT